MSSKADDSVSRHRARGAPSLEAVNEPGSNDEEAGAHKGKGKPVLDAEAIMQRVRAEVARRHAASGRPPRTHASERIGGAPPSDTRWMPAAPRLPDKAQYAVADFLGFDDEDFVDVVYRKLLRRSANDEGSRSYLEGLRSGSIGKVEILGLVRFSDEGRRNAVHVDGLLLPYTLHRWRHRRIVGWFIGLAMAFLRLPRLAWHLQYMGATAARESHSIGRLLNRSSEESRAAQTHLQAAIDQVRSDLASPMEAQQTRLGEQQTRLDEQRVVLDTLGKRVGEQDGLLATLHAHLEQKSAALAALQTQLDDRSTALAALQTHLADLERTSGEEQRRLRSVLERLTVFLDVNARQNQRGGSGGEEPVPESHYVAFEDAFRGERAQIKQRVAHYLGTLAAAGIDANGDGLVLDLGSGRGEWLEVLAENGYRGRGVDSDDGMIAISNELGQDVVKADVLDYLRVQDGDTFSAITAMHMVEHIPHRVLIDLLDQTLRVLRPGGVLILETPNPENVLVGACTFYLDPTHRNPIPPQLLHWMVQSRGFQDATIERLTEYRGGPGLQPLADEVPGAVQINQMVAWFTAPQDYAVIARKPATS